MRLGELERAVLGPPAGDLDLVFARPEGRPLDPRVVSPRSRPDASKPACRTSDSMTCGTALRRSRSKAASTSS